MLETVILSLLNTLKEIAEVSILGVVVTQLLLADGRKAVVSCRSGVSNARSAELTSAKKLAAPLCCNSLIQQSGADGTRPEKSAPSTLLSIHANSDQSTPGREGRC